MAYSQAFPYTRFVVKISKPHLNALLVIPSTTEFEKTSRDIIQHLPNHLIGPFWNLVQEHKKVWENNYRNLPPALGKSKPPKKSIILGRYGYLEKALINYRNEQRSMKKTKSFPFVFYDGRNSKPLVPKKKIKRRS